MNAQKKIYLKLLIQVEQVYKIYSLKLNFLYVNEDNEVNCLYDMRRISTYLRVFFNADDASVWYKCFRYTRFEALKLMQLKFQKCMQRGHLNHGLKLEIIKSFIEGQMDQFFKMSRYFNCQGEKFYIFIQDLECILHILHYVFTLSKPQQTEKQKKITLRAIQKFNWELFKR